METLGHVAYAAFEKYYRKISKHEPGVIRDRDVEAIHQMRVGLRRLRTALEVFCNTVRLPKGVSIQRVRAIAGSLSPVRDLDVMMLALKEQYYPHLPRCEQQQLAKLIKKLEKQRAELLQKALQLLRSDRYRKLQQGLEEWLAAPQYREIADLPTELIAPDILLPLVCQLLLHPGWQVAIEWQGDRPLFLAVSNPPQWLQTAGDVLHDLRKQTKRVRYQMELFSSVYGDAFSEQVAAFAQLQELLGTLHDGVVLDDFFRTQLGLNLRQASPCLAEMIALEQTRQWQTWRCLQQEYLSPEKRHQVRSLLLMPLTTMSANGHSFAHPLISSAN
ncbi:MAG: CHAD domain-containing protein [Thermosynechococcus sp.]|uniref:CHAD domain-containing protein n=1 Tax=Thermosynechococcus sp. TaxID=2814275 RepID=UPI0021F9A74A|nr:CHAD domain-containing protein [Thermosynechococcus sp.]BCX13214.1 MAG: CHAD domain-containing protein [Thermosynechococcus sp.]